MKSCLILVKFSKVAALLLSLLFTIPVSAQLSGLKNIPGDYATLDAALTDLNSQGVSASVTFNVLAGNPQVAPSGGYIIGGTGSAILTGVTSTSQTNQVYITGNGNTVTSDTNLMSGSLLDAIFKLIGADWITIENFTIIENPVNTDTIALSNNMTEFGIALLTVNSNDGSKYNTLEGNNISLNRTYANTFGIYSNVEHSSTNATTYASISSVGGSNSYLHIYSNQISNVNTGIAVIGSQTGWCTDQGLTIGDAFGNANTITNFGTKNLFSNFVSVPHNVCGIVVNNQLNCSISHNIINSSAGGTVSGTLMGIYSHFLGGLPTAMNFTLGIVNNSIALHTGNASGDMIGILNEVGTYGTYVDIDNNDFHDFIYSGNGNGNVTLLNNKADSYSISIDGNTFSNLSINTSGIITLLAHPGVPSVPNGSKIVSYNSIVGTFSKVLSGGMVQCCRDSMRTIHIPSTTTYVLRNNFSNMSMSGNTYFYGIYSEPDNPTINPPSYVVKENTINNVMGSISYCGIYSGTAVNIEDNLITGFNGSGNVRGIICEANDDAVISGNTIGALTSAATPDPVYGIFCEEPQGIKIFRNKIFDLSNTNNQGSVAGIFLHSTLQTSSGYMYNNMIGDLRTPHSNNPMAVSGIFVENMGSSGGTLDAYIYYNTIWINAMSTSNVFATSGIFAYGSILGPPTVRVKNNIIVNTSVPGISGGFNAAIKFDAYVSGHYINSDNNCYYIGTPSTHQLIFGTGSGYNPGLSAQTVPAFASFLGFSSETNSITENPPFLSTVGTSPEFLHIDSSVVTQIESGGSPSLGTDYWEDFDQQKRFGAAGYVGYGSATDIGADEIWNLPQDIDEKIFWGNHFAYPNPSSGIFHVANTDNAITQVEFRDLAGKQIQVRNINLSGRIDIDAGNLEPGVYILLIRVDDSESSQLLTISSQ